MVTVPNMGCSSFSWETEDGCHLCGRNFDYNTLADGSGILFIPRNKSYFMRGTSLEKTATGEKTVKYAIVGMGSLSMQSTPMIYDGLNEYGLFGAELNYRNFAVYDETPRENTKGLQPMFVLVHLLAQCKTVDEVEDMLRHEITIVNEAIFGTVATLHWIFNDKQGNTLVVECDEDGLQLYKNHVGVLTNSPDYRWHEKNMLNYANITNKDCPDIDICGIPDHASFSGTGMQGLPGDFTSTSRFVRLTLLKKYAEKGKNEKDGIAKMLRCFENVAFPLGAVKIHEADNATIKELSNNIEPYDYTIYTGIGCSESQTYYWTSYHNPTIHSIQLNQLKEHDDYLLFDAKLEPEIVDITPKL